VDIQKKTAIAVTGMNTLLTTLKFILYYLTGSYVILAEAWHSFSDIATSLLVLLAIHRKLRQEKSEQPANAEASSIAPEQTKTNRWNLESIVSLVIGLLLLTVSILLIRQVFIAEKPEVKNPLVAGIVFIGFAIGSYLVSHFEGAVGRKTNSVGLISDSMHARADMTASLLAGFSLILCSLNVDIDRWAALVISFFILTFSLEVLVNVFVSIFHGDGEKIFHIKSYQIVAYLFSPRELFTVLNSFDDRLGLKILHRPWFPYLLKVVFLLIPVTVLSIYLSTCFFSVAQNEQAILLRFGRPIKKELFNPGLHVKFPWPVDKVLRHDVRTIKSIPVGNITEKEGQVLIWTRAHGTEEEFLTGDNYFIFPFVIIHYRVKELYKFLFTMTDPIEFLRSQGNRVLSHLIAERFFYNLVTIYRSQIESDMTDRLQKDLDVINSGIEIVSINFKDIHPPTSIASSFEQVVAAAQEKEQLINKALGYKNENILKSLGDSVREIEKAKSYVVERVDRAQGEAKRFNLRKHVFNANTPVLSKKLYLKTVQEILPGVNKILYDPKAGHPSLWMGGRNDEVIPQTNIGKTR